jgi:hypothetical protein
MGMDEHRLKDIPPWKLKGLHISMVGMLIAGGGFVLFLFGIDKLGRAIIYGGFLVTFVGMVKHLRIPVIMNTDSGSS